MPDIASSISVALDIVAKLRNLGKTVSEVEFKMLLAELTSELADAKLEAANLKTDLAESKTRISELEKQLDISASGLPEIDRDTYVFADAPGRHFCMGCFDRLGKRITLKSLTGVWKEFGEWSCPSCEKTYG